MKLVLLLCLSLGVSDAYKILVVFTMTGRSHGILTDGLVATLTEAGHTVTVITPFPKETVPTTVHQVNISSILDLMPNEKLFNISEVSKSRTFALPMAFMGAKIQKVALLHENVQSLLNDQTQEFDVVIAQWFASTIVSGLSAVYQCPLIWVSSMDPHSQALAMVDESISPAYSASVMSRAVPPLTFTQRTQELCRQIIGKVMSYAAHLFLEEPYYKEIFAEAALQRGRSLPPLRDVAYSAAMMLFNAQPALGVPYSLPQSAKCVGGYHIDPKTKPLPEHLQSLFDNSKDGVIYFSLGSNLKSKDISEDIKRSLVTMFGDLKQTVVWKLEEELLALIDLPHNLHIVKWAPQQSILNHPNTRIFITHGGKLSTTETIHYGVPVIGIPIFGDQFSNMMTAVDKGYGIQVVFGDNLANDLRAAILEMLTNPSYTIKAKELSSIFHDLPVTPRQELTHWVEHVVRTKGAPHLRSPALMVPWYQKMYLDLAALLFVILYASCKLYTNL